MHPTFLIIGTAKAATTSLYHYVGQHPNVFMSPVKEPRFFHFAGQPISNAGPGDTWSNRKTVRNWNDYQALFVGGESANALGEASPVYLYSPHAASHIKKHLPDVRLIAVLRDPAERAYSHYLHLRRDAREPCEDFLEALSREAERVRVGWEWSWHYRSLGFYNAQLDRYAKSFSPDKIRVYLYDELISNPVPIVEEIFDFIGVDSSFIPDTRSQMNPGGLPSNEPLYNIATQYDHPLRKAVRPFVPEAVRTRLLTRLRKRSMARPQLPSEARTDLVRGFHDDIEQLQERIGRDLTAWMR